MASRSGGSRINTNKVRSGPDQAFTLPKGTSAAPIKGPGMGVKPKAKSKPKPKSKPKDISSDNITSKSIFSFFRDGFLVAGTSPKAWMFFPLIFPQFIDFNSNYIVQFFILITTYVVLDFLSLIAYAVLARKLIVWIKANPKVINTISACVLVIIAGIIVITQQY